MNKELFVSYDIALKVKEKGFNEPCLYYFDEMKDLGSTSAAWTCWNTSTKLVSMPLHQQVIDWLRIEHCIHICPKHHITSQTYGYVITGKYTNDIMERLVDCTFNKYEYYEMLEKSIETALNLI